MANRITWALAYIAYTGLMTLPVGSWIWWRLLPIGSIYAYGGGFKNWRKQQGGSANG